MKMDDLNRIKNNIDIVKETDFDAPLRAALGK